jgi:hypothetical protein
LIRAVVSEETVVEGALFSVTVTPNRAPAEFVIMLPSDERNRFWLELCPDAGRVIPYFGETAEEDGV